MNLEQLKTFIEIARLGSFSDVAKKLKITQPAVSFQIQKLEQELGIRLIDRSQRAVTPTAAGKRFLSFAEQIENEREKLRSDLDLMREDVSGDLLVVASTIPGEFLLPHILVGFKKLHPAVNVQVDISDSTAVLNGVQENRYEVGFCGVAPDEKELTAFKVGEDKIVLIAPPGHSLAQRSEITPSELENEHFIFRESTSGTQQNLEKHLKDIGLDIRKLKANLVLGTTQAVVAAVEDGAGIAFVSSLAIRKNLELGLVKQVSVKGMNLQRYFYCVYRQERIVSRLLEEFINFIKFEVSPGG